MAALLEALRAAGDPRQYFHATYQRTTIAVAEELERGGFADSECARRQGPDAYRNVLAQLEELSAAKVAALMAPGPVLLKLAATGFGVRLTPVRAG